MDDNVSSKKDNEENTCKKLVSKMGYYLYSYLPITLYLVCLYIVAVSRESLGTLTFIMVALIHPIISVPLGKFAHCIYKLLFESCFNKYLQNSSKCGAKFCLRFFTLSLNAYLTFAACCMYYLGMLRVATGRVGSGNSKFSTGHGPRATGFLIIF